MPRSPVQCCGRNLLYSNAVYRVIQTYAVGGHVPVFELNEVQRQVPEFWQGKRIIEMQKERPRWFSKNLLQKTTQQPSDSTDVKPTDLA
ncbi:39S ribosomal protein L32, mitochondrial [Eumeta japonica]|uniref:39S ribosomal protein L32, mitochondrial n=1 Tax=Eumeta variegata TaxID=151549 RepID=A0A4C1Z5K0_EUMVA|nr:39S ribosomal protein L32, mitochondrial [Eumeta japonica]